VPKDRKAWQKAEKEQARTEGRLPWGSLLVQQAFLDDLSAVLMPRFVEEAASWGEADQRESGLWLFEGSSIQVQAASERTSLKKADKLVSYHHPKAWVSYHHPKPKEAYWVYPDLKEAWASCRHPKPKEASPP
jgi:hypothetical protein